MVAGNAVVKRHYLLKKKYNWYNKYNEFKNRRKGFNLKTPEDEWEKLYYRR